MGATTLSTKALSRTTLGKKVVQNMTFNMTAFSIMTPSLMNAGKQ
jgi:hypothetical protein